MTLHSTQRQIAFLLFSFIFLTLSKPTTATFLNSYEPNQIVVKIDPLFGNIQLISSLYDLVTSQQLLGSDDIFLLEALPGVDVTQVVGLLSNHPLVEYAELNYKHEPPEGSGDDTYGWGGEVAQTAQDAAAAVNLPQAHTYSQGAGSLVAVLDTGMQLDHPALVEHIHPIGYDFVDDDLIPADEWNDQDDDEDGEYDELVGHGTHVSGIVNQVAPEAELMVLRVLNSDGVGNNFRLANAIVFAVLNGADVINLSLGSEYQSALLNDVLDMATAAGVVVVAAAGNMNVDVPQYPAASDCAIGVTSLGANNLKSDFSNYGEWVDIAAPGEAIISPMPTNGYAWWSGTSMATPFIAGQVALLRSFDEELTLNQIGLLIGGAAQPVDDANPGFEGQLGRGQTNMYGSLEYLMTDTSPPQSQNVLAECS